MTDANGTPDCTLVELTVDPTRERSALYYDQVYLNSVAGRGGYFDSAYRQRWLPLWVEVAYLVGRGDVIRDLGCGCGHLFEVLCTQQRPFSSYTGYDFSELAVAVARTRASLMGEVGRKGTFEVADLTTLALPADDHDPHFILTEVLEHVVEDRKLIGRLPAGARVTLSVPSFDDDAHVRVFARPELVSQRYGEMIAFDRLTAMKPWWIASGLRR